jgi:hypothetical protein
MCRTGLARSAPRVVHIVGSSAPLAGYSVTPTIVTTVESGVCALGPPDSCGSSSSSRRLQGVRRCASDPHLCVDFPATSFSSAASGYQDQPSKTGQRRLLSPCSTFHVHWSRTLPSTICGLRSCGSSRHLCGLRARFLPRSGHRSRSARPCCPINASVPDSPRGGHAAYRLHPTPHGHSQWAHRATL